MITLSQDTLFNVIHCKMLKNYVFEIKVTTLFNACIFTEYTAGTKAEPHGNMNSQSVSNNLIVILIGVVITLALLISILYAIRRLLRKTC